MTTPDDRPRAVPPAMAWVLPQATDCHAHIFDPLRFPYAAARRYTPPPARVADLREGVAAVEAIAAGRTPPTC